MCDGAFFFFFFYCSKSSSWFNICKREFWVEEDTFYHSGQEHAVSDSADACRTLDRTISSSFTALFHYFSMNAVIHFAVVFEFKGYRLWKKRARKTDPYFLVYHGVKPAQTSADSNAQGGAEPSQARTAGIILVMLVLSCSLFVASAWKTSSLDSIKPD